MRHFRPKRAVDRQLKHFGLNLFCLDPIICECMRKMFHQRLNVGKVEIIMNVYTNYLPCLCSNQT